MVHEPAAVRAHTPVACIVAALLGLIIFPAKSFAQSSLNISLVGSNEPPQATTGFGDTNLRVTFWQKGGGGAPVPTSDGHSLFSLGTTNNAQNYFRLKVQLSTNSSGSSPLAIPGGLSAFTSEAAGGPFRVYVK